MKVGIAIMLICLMGFTSAYTFCEDGNKGSLKIGPQTDKLDENFKVWEWREGQEIRLSFNVENNLNKSQDTTTEIIFLDDENKEVWITGDDLIETERISDKDNEDIDFNFDLRGNLDNFAEYKMFVKTYLTSNESYQCNQVEREIKINSLDSCQDNANLIINIKNYSEEWKTGENQEIWVEIKSLLPRDTYDIELIFYNDDWEEVEITDDGLTDTATFNNGTFLIEYDLELIEGITEGKYGIYISVISDDACAEKRLDEPYHRYNMLYHRYTPIAIKDTPGIIVASADGPLDIPVGIETTYKINLKNTGDDEPQVKVYIYSGILGLKETAIITDFKKDTSRSVNISFVAPNKLGYTNLGFFADYDYRDGRGYFEDTTRYNHDITKRVSIVPAGQVAPTIKEVIAPTPTSTNSTPPLNVSNETAVVPTEEKKTPWFNIFIILVVVAGGFYFIYWWMENNDF